MLDSFLILFNTSLWSALEFLDFSFNLTFLGDNYRCEIVWWIWNFNALVVFLECVDQSRNGNTRLIVSPINLWSGFRVGNNTTMKLLAWWCSLRKKLLNDELPSQIFITFRLKLIEIEALCWRYTFSKSTPVNARLGNTFRCHRFLLSWTVWL